MHVDGRMGPERGLLLVAIFASVGLVLLSLTVRADEPAYELVDEFDGVEVRRYPALVLAETAAGADFEGAGSEAFGDLFEYISGANDEQASIEMTSPVLQRTVNEGADFRVSFILPPRFDATNAPAPSASGITITQMPARQVAVMRYTGFWTAELYARQEAKLREVLRRRGYEPIGLAEWARYDPPFMPWFMRRNEVLIEVRSGQQG